MPLSWLLLAAAITASEAFSVPHVGARPMPLPMAQLRHVPARRPPRVSTVSMIGGFDSGFLNMGAPEVIVIGAVAWVVLGPKELFKLAKQAGEFVGQWQQLGMQAKDTFQSALEQELAEDEAKAAQAAEAARAAQVGANETPWDPAQAAAASTATATATEGNAGAGIPSLADYAAAREGSTPSATDAGLTSEDEAALRSSMYDVLGDPGSNSQNFADQISGARNAAVLNEYPSELSADDLPLPGPADGSPMDVQSADEMLLQNRIDETENDLQTLRAEKRVLALKRTQLEQNVERARKMAQERASEELAAAEAGEGAE